MDQRARKTKTIHKTLHPRDDIDDMCQEKKEEDDWFSLRKWVEASTQCLEDYI